MQPGNVGQLNTADWEKVQDLLTRFEAANRDGETAPLGSFLPSPESPLRLLGLRELIKSDMELRWRRGKGYTVEDYLTQFPELVVQPDQWAPLLAEEYRVRRAFGDKPELLSYQKRFPEQFRALELLVQEGTHTRTIRPASAAGTDDTQPTVHEAGKPSAGAPKPAPTQPPVVGGGYHLIKRIGSGSFGEVWRAEAPGGVAVAIKIIFRPLDHEEAQRELQALELIKQLRHPYLAQTQAFWSQADKLYIVMELADGSLRDRAKECRQAGSSGIPVPELLGYFHEAAEALDYLHSRDMLHRDIKPDNLLLVKPEGAAHASVPAGTPGVRAHLKLGDFGLVRILESQRLGASGAGTPAYMPPEVWNGQISRHSDQFSLAVTYVELRLGRPVYAGSNMYELMIACLSREPDLAGLEDGEREVLRKALHKDPTQRFGSCLEFVHVLDRAVTPAAPPPAPVSGSAPTSPDLGTLVPGSTPGMVGGARGPAWRADTERFPGGTSRGQGRGRGRNALVLLLLALAAVGTGAYLFVPRDREREDTPPPAYLPPHPGWQMEPGARTVTDDTGRRFYERLEFTGAGAPFRFVLVPRRADDMKKIPTFYIMKDKVAVAQFRLFAAEAARAGFWKVKDNKWAEPDGVGGAYPQDNHPVFNVGVEDAYQLAHWLHGNLPTADQWDKAAGRFEAQPGEGPFRGPWDKDDPRQIAVSRFDKGPMACGEATRDESPFGCRDMAGNGREWTRNLDQGGKTVPLSNPTFTDRVLLRGRTYRGDWGPLRFQDLANAERDDNPDTGFYQEAAPDVGFRVVLEP